jgi:hypothetical protein
LAFLESKFGKFRDRGDPVLAVFRDNGLQPELEIGVPFAEFG